MNDAIKEKTGQEKDHIMHPDSRAGASAPWLAYQANERYFSCAKYYRALDDADSADSHAIVRIVAQAVERTLSIYLKAIAKSSPKTDVCQGGQNQTDKASILPGLGDLQRVGDLLPTDAQSSYTFKINDLFTIHSQGIGALLCG